MAQINLQVPQRVGNYLANLSTKSFSRFTRLQLPCERKHRISMHGFVVLNGMQDFLLIYCCVSCWKLVLMSFRYICLESIAKTKKESTY